MTQQGLFTVFTVMWLLLATPVTAQTFGDHPKPPPPSVVVPTGPCLRASCMPVVPDRQAAWDRALTPVQSPADDVLPTPQQRKLEQQQRAANPSLPPLKPAHGPQFFAHEFNAGEYLAARLTATAPVRNNERRIALVVGNSAYKNATALPNAIRDANLIADALKRTGFETVTVLTDLPKDALVGALRDFAARAEAADWALVYFAGHGMEVGGTNYLIPTDAKISVDRDIGFEAVPLEHVLNAAERAKKLRLVILDACRDNPFANRMKRTLTAASRSVSRGLASIEPEAGTLVVYAAKDGETALDGDGINSPFASAFVKNLPTPGLEVRRLFDFVRDDVMEATGRKQKPFSYGSISGRQDFYFVPGNAKPQVVPSQSTVTSSPEPPKNSAVATPDLAPLQQSVPVAAVSAQPQTQVSTAAAKHAEPTKLFVRPGSWIIQVGSLPSEAEAKARLNEARDHARAILGKAQPFTEAVAKGDKQLYRARFTGFADKANAEEVCRTLKRSDVPCFAMQY
jgi:hypothetical protein